jgi:hypothetical protein
MLLILNKNGRSVQYPDMDKSIVFLQNIFAKVRGEYVELRLIRDNAVQTIFIPSIREGRDFWLDIADMNVAGYNVYFGVCGRREKKGTAEGVGVVPSLWFDIDNLDEHRISELCSLWYENEVLPIPSYVVKSGHGLHVYWILRKPIQTKTDAERRKIAGYLHGLADFLHADRCYDLARVMRLPETINWKYPDEPAKSEIYLDHWEDSDIVRYPLSSFDEYWAEPVIARSVKKLGFDRNAPAPDLSRLPQGVRNLVTKPPPKGERSQAAFIVIKAMQAAGYSPDEVKAVLMNNPIGDRYGE